MVSPLMKTVVQRKLDDVTPETYHVFKKNIVTILSFFYVIKEPTSHYILNMLLMASVFILYVYLLITTIITIVLILSDSQSSSVIRVFTQLCLEVPGFTLPLVLYVTHDKVLASFYSYRNGVFRYVYELPDRSHEKIKKNRVEQILLYHKTITFLCFLNGLNNILLPPIMQSVSGNEVTSGNIINPYLPLPIYTPFNTRNLFGFSVAFFLHVVFYIFFNFTLIIVVEIHLSLTLQLIAQIEILNDSIKNIEQRAYALALENGQSVSDKLTESIYDSEQFQDCLYICLRENVLHHHAILRLKNTMTSFLEGLQANILIFFSIVMAVSLLAIIEDPQRNISLLAIIVVDCAGVFPVCLVGQFVTDKSAETTTALYSTPWPDCKRGFNLLLNIMLANSQEPIVLTALGRNGPQISLETFGNMMSLSYKIVNLLR